MTGLSERAETQFVDVKGARIAYRSLGKQGTIPLLFCMRFRGTIDHWDPALLDLIAAERHVIVFDNAGISASSGEPANSVAGMASWAAAFVEALKIPQVDVFGWSLGGTVAQQLALDYPKLVRRLVLATTGPGGVADAPRAPEKVWQIAAKPVNDDEDFLYLFFTESAASRQAGLASLRRLDKRLNASRAAVAPAAIKAQVEAIGAWSAGKNSALPRLGEIKAPALIVNGVHDIMTHAYNSYVMSQKMPNAQLILYPDSGHGFLFQYPEQFARDVLRFLS